jgi:hypothetical protein
MPRIYDSANDPLDFCLRHFPSEEVAERRYGNVAKTGIMAAMSIAVTLAKSI